MGLCYRSETIKRLEELGEVGKASAEDVSSLRKNIATLQHGVQVSTLSQEAQETIASLIRLSSKALGSITSRRILNSLDFPEMHTRYAKVPNAYSKTFEWIFEEQAPQKQQKALEGRMLFREWLKVGDGVFHVSGKPGAGKSTLMRFISKHTETKKLLASWAADRKPVFGKFFFWKPGSYMENSIPAMLRTLIYDTLKQCPELTEVVFPQHWSQVHSVPWQEQVNLRFDDDEIREAFDRLIRNRNLGEDRCLCFLIDGLDEFRETPEENNKFLVKLLSNWTEEAGRDLKLCVSSREYDVFLERFEGPRGFKLQELTYDDIYEFTREKLELNQNFVELEKPLNGGHRLISKVANKADGVFMWVSLVVNQLDSACDDGFDFSQLEDQIDCNEKEVQDLFRQLLDSIKDSDKDRSAQTFAFILMLLENNHGMRMSLFRYSLLSDFFKNPKFAADIDGLKKAGLVGTDKANIERRTKTARKLLYRYCKGLLEVHNNEEDPLEKILNPHRIALRRNTHLAKSISLAHRDVVEFLLEESVKKDRTARIQEFDMFGAICQTFTAEVASTMAVKEDSNGTWENQIESIFYVPELMDILRSIPQRGSVKEQHLRALDNLDVLRRPSEPSPKYREGLHVEILSPEIAVPYFGSSFSFSVCHFAAALGVEEYFGYEADLTGRDAATKDGSLASVLIEMLSIRHRDRFIGTIFNYSSYPAILRRMLQHGCCPNRATSGGLTMSAWELFVSVSMMSGTPWKFDAPGAEMAKVFLEFGADPNISFEVSANKWEKYLEIYPSIPGRPTNVRAGAAGHGHETLEFLWKLQWSKRRTDLRDVFEYLNPPNLQTLLALLDERKESQQKKVSEGSGPDADTEATVT